MDSNILDTLYPLVADKLDKVFPEMGFTKSKGGWISNKGLQGRSPSNTQKDKSFSYPNKGYFTIVEQGSTPLSYVDYWLLSNGYSIGDKGEAFKEAIKALCGKVGLQIEQDEEAFRKAQKERERQLSLEDINNRMRNALFNEAEAKPVLSYLKEVRGYAEETDIDGEPVNVALEMGLGFVTPTLLQELKAAMGELWNENIDAMGIGSKYLLSVPCRNEGKIVGYNFRAIDKEASPKYVNSFKSGEKGKYLFGLSPLSVHKSDYKNLTIVEGEIDALHATILGLSNVVAMGGKYVPVKALKAAKRKGFENVTLLLDNDKERETPQAEAEYQQERERTIRNFLEQAKEVGLQGYIAELPVETDAQGKRVKMDVDTLLLSHSVSELKDIIDRSTTGAKYLFAKIVERAEQEDLTDKRLKQLKEEVIDIIRWADNATDKSYIKAAFSEILTYTNGEQIITEKDIQDRIEELNEAEAQATKAKKLSEALKQAEAMGTDEALSFMEDALKSLNRIGTKEKFYSLLNDDIEVIFDGYKQKPKTIKTGFQLGTGKDAYRFSLPSGAITIVAAPTNHGKSKMLQSLALDTAENGEEGTVLYLTYEENKQNVVKQLLNAYADIEITKETAHFGNIQTITEYLYNGSTQYIKAEALQPFRRKVEGFKQLYKSGKIKVVKPEDNYLGTLSKFLRYAVQEINLKAIFVDYVQELYLEDNRVKARADELKEIMVEIDLIAQEADIPIILAAQLRRETSSPVTMANQDISDSGWIERKASEILLLWSNKERCKNDKEGKETDKANREIVGLDLGTRGKLYAKLTKSRLNATGVDAVLSINGNTGRVKANYETKPPTQEDIPFAHPDDMPSSF